jgi:hypothetical protein
MGVSHDPQPIGVSFRKQGEAGIPLMCKLKL